jgi:hypothetical protein
MHAAVSLAEKDGFRARLRTIARSNAVDSITTVTLVIRPLLFNPEELRRTYFSIL